MGTSGAAGLMDVSNIVIHTSNLMSVGSIPPYGGSDGSKNLS